MRFNRAKTTWHDCGTMNGTPRNGALDAANESDDGGALRNLGSYASSAPAEEAPSPNKVMNVNAARGDGSVPLISERDAPHPR